MFKMKSLLQWNVLTSHRLVLKSIGYKSLPVDGLPFDHKKGMLHSYFTRTLKACILIFVLFSVVEVCVLVHILDFELQRRQGQIKFEF